MTLTVLPPPELCDVCRGRVDVRWQDLDGYRMALCSRCAEVGGSDER